MRGENHPTYKGRLVTPNGYVRVWKPDHPLAHKDGYVPEHRMIVYDAGIIIPNGYHVHHLDHHRDHNVLENLAVMSASAHALHHMERGSLVRNQFGLWVIGDEEAKRIRKIQYMAEWRSRNAEHIREYKRLHR